MKKVILLFLWIFISRLIYSNEKINYKKVIIKDYSISLDGTYSILDRITKMNYDNTGKIKQKRYYQGLFGGLAFHTMIKYEYPDNNIMVEYFYSKHETIHNIIYKYDKNKNIINQSSGEVDKRIFLLLWKRKYTDLIYKVDTEFQYEYNFNNDLEKAIQIQSYFSSMRGPLENLPTLGYQLNQEQLFYRYKYNEKKLKKEVFGGKNENGQFINVWKYIYDKNNKVIKIEEYIREKLFSVKEYGYYEDGKLKYEIHKSSFPEMLYDLYEYDENNRLIYKRYYSFPKEDLRVDVKTIGEDFILIDNINQNLLANGYYKFEKYIYK